MRGEGTLDGFYSFLCPSQLGKVSRSYFFQTNTKTTYTHITLPLQPRACANQQVTTRTVALVYPVTSCTLSVSVRVTSADCSFPSPLLDLSEANSQLQGCTNVTSDLVIGDPACSGGSTVPFLLGEATTRSVQEIVGSLIIQCCNGLSLVSGWSALQTIRGSLIIEANMDLQSVMSAFAALNRLDGSLTIRQNGALTSVVTSFLALDRIGGYINIERNQKLNDLSGLGTLSVIEGKQLLVGSALSVLFNPALEDLAWLASMDSIENGVVHIEGNTALCYAGYPQWGTFGSFFNRSGVLGEDKGIDWQSLISSTAEWEYSWTGTSIPSLVVKGNAPSGSCGAFHVQGLQGA